MEILRAIRPNTRLISVMLANNETGVVQPVEEIGKIAAQTGVFFHIDAVQGAGKVPIDVKRIGCHILTISGHKMHAPKGIGAMYVQESTALVCLGLRIHPISGSIISREKRWSSRSISRDWPFPAARPVIRVQPNPHTC